MEVQGLGKLQPWHLQGGVRRSAWLPVEFQRVKKLVQEIKEAGGEAIFVQTDVSKAAQVQTLIEKTVEEYGRLDCAFNNAGIEGPHFVPLTDYSEEDWDQLMDINLKGVWLCMKYAIPHMLKQSNRRHCQYVFGDRLNQRPFRSALLCQQARCDWPDQGSGTGVCHPGYSRERRLSGCDPDRDGRTTLFQRS